MDHPISDIDILFFFLTALKVLQWGKKKGNEGRSSGTPVTADPSYFYTPFSSALLFLLLFIGLIGFYFIQILHVSLLRASLAI